MTYVNGGEPLNSILKKEANCAFKPTYGATEAHKREFPHQVSSSMVEY